MKLHEKNILFSLFNCQTLTEHISELNSINRYEQLLISRSIRQIGKLKIPITQKLENEGFRSASNF